MKSAGTIQKNTEKRASHDVLFSLCENAADRLILLVLLGSVLLFILWPIACIALRSLRGADGGVSFAMFGTVLRQYGESLRNSVFVGVFTAVLSTILSLSAALVCATARGWKKTLCMVIMLVAMVSPPFVSSLAYIQLYGRRGWITYRLLHLSLNPYNRWGVILMQSISFVPLNAMFLSGILEKLDEGSLRSARDLGASGGAILRDIVLPLIRPATLVCLLLSFVRSLADFGTPIIIGGRFSTLAADIYLQVVGYPNIMRVGTFERIGHHAVLITIPGSDASLRPCLYMSHQDVVPVVEGTEQDWTHPAFSGDIADGYIWGRGTLDIKEQVFGVLEAAEYLLARGKSFARTAYLAFGDDEETINLGALAIAEHLKAQGVTLEFVLDEGGCKIEPGTAFGAPETFIVSVQLMEKGYADLELSVHSIGGHSSRPYGGTSLGRLSGAIADITRAPFAVHLNSAMTGAFETLAPYITQEPLKTLVQDVAGNADAIAACCMSSPDLFPFVTTTIAPTMIRGGSAACNVMPQDMTAVINFRLADGDTVESVMAHCREAVQDKGVEMRFLQANDPSAIAKRDGYGYRTVVESFQRYYPEAVFIPSMAVGATDAHRYEEICDTCLRCSPFMTEPAEAASGVHGTNERLLVRSYLQGIRVLIDLMEHANVEP